MQRIVSMFIFANVVMLAWAAIDYPSYNAFFGAIIGEVVRRGGGV